MQWRPPDTTGSLFLPDFRRRASVFRSSTRCRPTPSAVSIFLPKLTMDFFLQNRPNNHKVGRAFCFCKFLHYANQPVKISANLTIFLYHFRQKKEPASRFVFRDANGCDSFYGKKATDHSGRRIHLQHLPCSISSSPWANSLRGRWWLTMGARSSPPIMRPRMSSQFSNIFRPAMPLMEQPR